LSSACRKDKEIVWAMHLISPMVLLAVFRVVCSPASGPADARLFGRGVLSFAFTEEATTAQKAR
jgi:hypothetical protein